MKVLAQLCNVQTPECTASLGLQVMFGRNANYNLNIIK